MPHIFKFSPTFPLFFALSWHRAEPLWAAMWRLLRPLHPLTVHSRSWWVMSSRTMCAAPAAPTISSCRAFFPRTVNRLGATIMDTFHMLMRFFSSLATTFLRNSSRAWGGRGARDAESRATDNGEPARLSTHLALWEKHLVWPPTPRHHNPYNSNTIVSHFLATAIYKLSTSLMVYRKTHINK